MNSRYQLCFTQQGIVSFNDIGHFSERQRLSCYLLTDLCYFPLQGQLLLNRHSDDNDVNQLRWELAEKYEEKELLWVNFERWLIIYLADNETVYLLDCILLRDELLEVWKS